jgi:type IV pilus assembly protein PilE
VLSARGGFTLIELLVAMAIVAVLACIAYPSFEGPIQRARRADALIALTTLHAAQERWRSAHRRYASLEELGLPALSPDRHYALRVAQAGEDGFELHAVAQGAQARDEACRFLALAASAGALVQSSGPNERRANPGAANRRCWNP